MTSRYLDLADALNQPVFCDRCRRAGVACHFKLVRPLGRCAECETGKFSCSLTPHKMGSGQPYKNSPCGAKAREWRLWAEQRKAKGLRVPELAVWDEVRRRWVEDERTWDARPEEVAKELQEYQEGRMLSATIGTFFIPGDVREKKKKPRGKGKQAEAPPVPAPEDVEMDDAERGEAVSRPLSLNFS